MGKELPTGPIKSFDQLNPHEFVDARELINPMVAYDIIDHARSLGKPYVANPDLDSLVHLVSVDLEDGTMMVLRRVDIFDPAHPLAQIAIVKGDSAQVWHITREGFIKESDVKGKLQSEGVMTWFEQSVGTRTTGELLEEKGVSLEKFTKDGHAGTEDISEIEKLGDALLQLAKATGKEIVGEKSDLTHSFFDEESFAIEIEDIVKEIGHENGIFSITGENTLFVTQVADPLSGAYRHVIIYHHAPREGEFRHDFSDLYFFDDEGILQVSHFKEKRPKDVLFNREYLKKLQNNLLSTSQALFDPTQEDTFHEEPQKAQDWEKEFMAYIVELHGQRLILARDMRDYMAQKIKPAVVERAYGRIEQVASWPEANQEGVISLYSYQKIDNGHLIAAVEHLSQRGDENEGCRDLLYLMVDPLEFYSRFVVDEPFDGDVDFSEIQSSHVGNFKAQVAAKRRMLKSPTAEVFRANETKLQRLDREWPLMGGYEHKGEASFQPTPNHLKYWFAKLKSAVEATEEARSTEALRSAVLGPDGKILPKPRKNKRKK